MHQDSGRSQIGSDFKFDVEKARKIPTCDFYFVYDENKSPLTRVGIREDEIYKKVEKNWYCYSGEWKEKLAKEIGKLIRNNDAPIITIHYYELKCSGRSIILPNFIQLLGSAIEKRDGWTHP